MDWTVYDKNTDEIKKFIKSAVQNHPVITKLWPKWRQNLYYIFGEDSTDLAGYVDRNVDDEGVENRLKFNRLLPIINTKISKLMKRQVIIDVTPEGAERDDELKADNSDALLKYQWRKQDMTIKEQEFLNNLMSFGTAFFKIYWDKDEQGEIVVPDEDSIKQMDVFDTPEEAFSSFRKKVKSIKIGDIKITVPQTFEIFPDPYASNIDECRFIIHAYVKPTEWVYETYGKKVTPERYDNFFANDEPASDTIMVAEYWEKPNKQHPNGRLIITAGDEVLVEEDFPYDFYPFVMAQEYPNYGRFWGQSLISYLLPIQKYYNSLNSFILDNIEAMASLLWALPLGTQVDIQAFESKPGAYIRYDTSRGQPYQIAPKPLPQQVFLLKQFLQIEFDEISGQHEVSQGKAPYSNMPTSSLSLLLEQDDTRLSITMNQFYKSLRELSRKALILMQKYYTEPRLIRILGEDRVYDSREIQGRDISFADIIVEPVMSLPLTREGQQRMVIELWQNKLIDTPQKAIRLLGLESLKSFYKANSRDVLRAKRENSQMREGNQARRMMLDNDAIHIEVHGDYMKTYEFEKLPQEIQQLFMQHVSEHIQNMQQVQPPPPQGAREQGGGGQQMISPDMLQMMMMQGGGE